MNEGFDQPEIDGVHPPESRNGQELQEPLQRLPLTSQQVRQSAPPSPSLPLEMTASKDTSYRSSSTRRGWLRQIRYVYYRFIRLRSTPEELSRGLASGVFAGCFPLFGFQTLLGIAIASILRGNKIAAAAGTWVSNPLTYVPIYAFNLWIGQFVTGIELDQVLEADLQSWSTVKTMGADILLTLMIGSAMVGLVASIASYFIGVRLTRNLQRRQRHRRHLRHLHSAAKQNRDSMKV